MEKEKIRIIVCSYLNGSNEMVTFTDSFESDAYDYCLPGQTTDIDEIIEMEIPNGFPLNITLKHHGES